MSLASFNAAIERDLAIAAQADRHHCSRCGRHLDRWYYGFPLPLCAICVDIGKWGCCPVCLWTCRQEPPGSGVLGVHGSKKSPCLGSGQQFTADQIDAAFAARDDQGAAPEAAGTETTDA